MNKDDYHFGFIMGAMFGVLLAVVIARFLPDKETVKVDLPQCKPLTYDEQHTMCYRFMVDNPHVRQNVCEKKFMQVPKLVAELFPAPNA